MLDLKERYERDNVFRAIVDQFRALMEQSAIPITPTEVREAAMLATMMYEYTHIRPITIDRNEILFLNQKMTDKPLTGP
jgi:hypothetical protein